MCIRDEVQEGDMNRGKREDDLIGYPGSQGEGRD